MVQAFVERNPETGKFECVISIKGGNKMQFIKTGKFVPVEFRSSGVSFPIWFKEREENAEIYNVIITDKKPESGTIWKTDQWLIAGYFVSNGQKFEGYYNTRTRNGHIRFID